MTSSPQVYYYCAMPQDPIRRNFITVPRAAQLLHLSERTILHLIATGEIAAEPLDPERQRTIWLIHPKEIEKHMKERGLS